MEPISPNEPLAAQTTSLPPVGSASLELALMLAILEHVSAERAHGDHRIAAALADAGRAIPDPRAWAARATRAGERLGVVVEGRRQSLAEAIAGGPRQGPLTTIARLDGALSVVTIAGWRGPLVRLIVGAGDDQVDAGWIGGDALAERLDVGADGLPVWLVAEPAVAAGLAAEPGQSMTPGQRLRGLMRVEAPDLWVVATYAVGVGIFTLATPIAVQALVNTVAFGALLQPLVVLSILLLGGLAFAGALRAMQAWVVEVIQQRWMIRVIGDLAHRLPRAAAPGPGQGYVPELVNRFFDVVTVQKAASSLLLDGLSVVLQAAIGMVVLAFYHPLLLAFDVLLLAAVAAIVLGFGRAATKSAIKESKAKYAVAAWLEELARHPRTFKGDGGPELAAKRADELARGYLGARRRHFRALFRQIVGALGLQAVASAALLGLGGWLVIARQLTLGQLVAAELIVSVVVAAFAKFGKHLETYYDLIAAIDKLGALADLPLERGAGESLAPREEPASLRLRGVRVDGEGEGDGSRAVLAGLDLEVGAGEAVAVLGRAASGKSTLAALLDGLVAPRRGVVEIDGVDLRDRALRDLRRSVCVVGGAEIFAGSLADNVRLDRPAIALAAVRTALLDVGLGPLLDRLGGDIDAPLGTGGGGLSESEALRIGLARAIVAGPRLLVLDGVLDVLDDAAQAALRGRLLREDRPWTLLVLTRSAALARTFPRSVALENGALRPLGAGAQSRPYTR